MFPYPIEVISGQEEARLIYQGVAHYIHHDDNRLVIDIGGGSTELIIGKHFEHTLLASRNMGCVNYTKQFFSDGQITAKRFAKAEVRAEQELEVIFANYLSAGWQSVVGTSGTIKSILAMINANEPTRADHIRRLLELSQFIAAKQIAALQVKVLHLSDKRVFVVVWLFNRGI